MTLAAMALAGLFGLALASSRIYLSLDPQALRVGLWPFSHRVIQLSDIVQHEIVAVRPSTFGGVGFRKTPGKKTGYLWEAGPGLEIHTRDGDRKSTRLNSSHVAISYAVFCLKKKKNIARVPS